MVTVYAAPIYVTSAMYQHVSVVVQLLRPAQFVFLSCKTIWTVATAIYIFLYIFIKISKSIRFALFLFTTCMFLLTEYQYIYIFSPFPPLHFGAAFSVLAFSVVPNSWIWTANRFAKFHAKRINRSENVPKSYRRGYFFETPCTVPKTLIKMSFNKWTNSLQ